MCSEGGAIPARAGHSTVECSGKLYAFGGQDDDNNKLDDVWCFDPNANEWSKCEQEEGALKPTPRCGHTAVCAGSKMFVFGGILELTKELNDLCIFNTSTGKWEQAPEMIGGEDDENQ
jgi:N-acetylneuraminic acid mutarotase